MWQSPASSAGSRDLGRARAGGACLVVGLLALTGCSGGSRPDAAKSSSSASASASSHPSASATGSPLTSADLAGVWLPETLYSKAGYPLVSAKGDYTLVVKGDSFLTLGVPAKPWEGACRGSFGAKGESGGKLADLAAGGTVPLDLNCVGTSTVHGRFPTRKYSGTVVAVVSDGRVGQPGEVIMVVTWADKSKDYLTSTTR
jgi:hypothetical protein